MFANFFKQNKKLEKEKNNLLKENQKLRKVNWNNNLKITKNIQEANCITHTGKFHTDEVFATVILSKVLKEFLKRNQDL